MRWQSDLRGVLPDGRLDLGGELSALSGRYLEPEKSTMGSEPRPFGRGQVHVRLCAVPALRLHRIAYLGCAIGALACGRTTASSVLEISAVTTTTSHASPGQTIDVDVHLHNHGSSRLELVTDELSMLPEQESFIYVPAAGNTDTLSPGAQCARSA